MVEELNFSHMRAALKCSTILQVLCCSCSVFCEGQSISKEGMGSTSLILSTPLGVDEVKGQNFHP